MNTKLPVKICSSLKLFTHFWLWLFCSTVQMNLGDNFLCLRLLKPTKPVSHDRKNERDWSKGRKEEKRQREIWFGSGLEIYWQIRVKTKGAWWRPNYGSQKAKQKFIRMSFISSCGGHKTNGWERDWVWWLPLLYPDLHFWIYWVHLFFKMNVWSCVEVRKWLHPTEM